MRLDEATGLTVADVTHSRFSAMPPDTTVGAVAAWFADSDSHNMAVFADADGRYAGSLVRADLDGAEPAATAAELATTDFTVAPSDPAALAEERALSTPARRVPVVDHDGRLVGIVAITADLQRFCGT
jgi:CBS-domain-containing membrane protein